MATRYKCTEYKSLFSQQNSWSIYIDDSQYTGAVTEIQVASPGFVLSWDGDNEFVKGGLWASSCKVGVMIENVGMESLAQDIALSPEGRFTMRITKKNLSSETTEWVGIILPDVSDCEDFVFPYKLNLTATDGIGRLKDIDYKSGSQPYGYETFVSHLINALTLDPVLSNLYFTSSNIFLRTVVDWWEAEHGAVTNNKCPLAHTRVNGAVWAKKKSTNSYEFKSCYEVLNSIAEHFRARLYIAGGSWRFEQINARRVDPVVERRFARTKAFLNSGVINYVKPIDNTAIGSKLSFPTFGWFPALNSVMVEYDHGSYRNQLAGEAYRWGTTGISNSEFEISNLKFDSDTFIKVTGTIKFRITSSATVPFRFLFKLKVKTNNGELSRPSTVVPNQYIVNYDPPSWQTTGIIDISTDFIFEPSLGISTNKEGEVSFTIWSPYVPTSSNEVRVDFLAFGALDKNGNSVAATLNEWVVKDLLMIFENLDNADNKEVAREYGAYSPFVGNTQKVEFKALFGEAVNPWTVGRLQTSSNGSTWADATNTWGAGSAGTSAFSMIFAKETMAAQLTAIRRLSASFTGAVQIDPWRRFDTSDGYKYLLMNGSFTGETETLEGDWWEAAYSSSPPTTTTVKSYAQSQDPGAATNPIPGIFVPNGSTTKAVDNSSNVALAALATNFTSATLAVGAVTAIPLDLPAKANSYLPGDEIMLLNPGTGKIQTLTVTAANAAGATSLAVSGTLTEAFPRGSMLLYSTLNKFTTEGSAQAFELPPIGTSLQLLRVNAAGTGIEWWTLVLGGGTVTSVALSLPGIFSVTGSPVTGSGTLTAALMVQAINTIFAGPASGGSGAPAFRALVAADIPALDATKITSGIIPVSRGGTGLGALGTALQIPRTNAAATAIEWFTFAGLSGTLAAGRVPFASSASVLTDDATFVWDNTNKRLIIGGTAGSARLNIQAGAVSGAQEFLRMEANVNGNMLAYLINASGLAAGNAIFAISVGAATAGDPVIQFSVVGGTTWAIGADNSDADAFKISNNSLPGTNDRFIAHTDGRIALATGALITGVNLSVGGTGSVAPPTGTTAQRPTAANRQYRHNSDFDGLEFKNQFGSWHRITSGNASPPTLTIGAALGTTPTTNLLGRDLSGILTLTCGSAPGAAGGNVITVNFNQTFSVVPTVSLTANSANFYDAGFYIETVSNANFVIRSKNVLVAAAVYKITYQIMNL